jgi:inner membrane protein
MVTPCCFFIAENGWLLGHADTHATRYADRHFSKSHRSLMATGDNIDCKLIKKDSDMDAIWWWCGLGLILLCVEMLLGTLYFLWLGIAALVMAFVCAIFTEMPLALQALNYAVLAAVALAVMRKLEKRKPVLRVGQAQGEEIGREGIVIAAISPQQPGKIRFSQGVLGSREWVAYADTVIAEQQAAKIIAVEGNSLRVAPL